MGMIIVSDNPGRKAKAPVKRKPVKKAPVKRKAAPKRRAVAARKAAPKYYYSLLSFEHGRWVPEFGDYDKETVQYKYDDYRDRGYKASQLKMIRTGDKSTDIMEAVKLLNK